MSLPSQAVVLAGGISRRLAPFNQAQNKAELTLMGRPILSWTLGSLQLAGFTEVVVVINPHMQLDDAYWSEWQTAFQKVSVVVQPISNGQAGALLAARSVLAERFVVVNANHFTAHEQLGVFESVQTPAALLITPTTQPQLYGVVTFDPASMLARSVVEKPSSIPDQPHRLVGIYQLNSEFISELAKREITETSLEQLLNDWAQQDRISCRVTTTELPSLKYAWQLLACKEVLWPRVDFHIAETAIIAPTALIRGEVYIGDGALIADYAIIDGPAYIGAHAVVGQYCVVRKGSVLETGAQIQRHGDISNSILMQDAQVHSGFVGDSIIGARTKIGAGFITANRRLDRAEIYTYVQGKKIATGLTSLGALIGPDTRIGIHSGTMPNVLIQANSTVSAGTIVTHNIE